MGFLILEKTILLVALVEILWLVCRLGFLPSKATVRAVAELPCLRRLFHGLSIAHDLGFNFFGPATVSAIIFLRNDFPELLQDWFFEGIWDTDNFTEFIDSPDLRFATSRIL